MTALVNESILPDLSIHDFTHGVFSRKEIEMMIGNHEIHGPNAYGWLGLVLFVALSLWELSWWPISVFIGVSLLTGLTAFAVIQLTNRKEKHDDLH